MAAPLRLQMVRLAGAAPLARCSSRTRASVRPASVRDWGGIVRSRTDRQQLHAAWSDFAKAGLAVGELLPVGSKGREEVLDAAKLGQDHAAEIIERARASK